MTDTKRTSAELISALADNISGNISEQDLRDLVVSMIMPHGNTDLFSNLSETTINSTNVFEVIAGVFSQGGSGVEVTESSIGGRLTYTGVPDRHFMMSANASFFSISNNQIIAFQWRKNGSILLDVPVEAKVGTGSDIGTLSCGADVMMSTDDYVELVIANETSTANVVVDHAYLFATGIFG